MNFNAEQDLIPVTLLTGFLGSGKTTVLNHIVRQPELADALVIINEFGEMPLDHTLVAHSTENLVMEMSSGCLCCTIRGDLVKALHDITQRCAYRDGRNRFRQVLIETTGLADPAPIIHTLMTHPQIASHYRLDGIVATLDLATGLYTLDQHVEAIKQAAMADCLLLTKADLATVEQRIELFRRLKDINPAASCWEVRHGEIAAAKLLNLGLFSTENKIPDVKRWLREEAYAEQTSSSVHLEDHHHSEHAAHHGHKHNHDHSHHDINRHDDHIRAFCFSVDDPIPESLLAAWLEVLMDFVGRDILRVKGLLNIEGNAQPVVIHGVQHIFHPPVSLPAWPDEDRRSRLVFITRDVDRGVIEDTFRTFQHILPQVRDRLQ